MEDCIKNENIVGGYIETYPLDDLDEIVVICNEEGKIKNLPLNRCIYKNGEIVEIIAGTFFICLAPVNSDNFIGLNDELANKYCELFEKPEKIFSSKGKIIVEEWPF